MTSFSEFGLHDRLCKAIAKLDFSKPTLVQQKTIPLAKSGKDIVVSAKTGSGKTAAYIIPLLQQFLAEDKPRSGTRGLILVPTRDLALQIDRSFKALAAFTQARSGVIMGGEAFKHQVATIRRNPEVIIATPGRLIEHIEKKNIDFLDLEMLILDEADRMLDMGFAEALHQIFSVCAESRQVMLFSATFNHRAFSRVRAQLKSPVHVELGLPRGGNENIIQQRILADSDEHKEKLAVALIEADTPERAFLFCNTRLQAQKLSNILRASKIRSEYIHGEISQSDRKQVLNRFRDGKIQVLVATDVAARGLDIEDLGMVINFNVAQSGDDHVHRVGRTGRAGKKGLAVTLVDAKEWNRMSSIERYLKFRFDKRELEGLVANYKGPKKLKSSGKAYGPKNKKNNKVNKAKKSAGKTAVRRRSLGDGSAPLKRR